ncbi:Calmodulin-binding transcription activator 6 [Platanthera guangdongensis]|uniref:Calmodulin-binding transcription activator 6 n=1 Tax=Platanthera guangdongensis TaxID=2320717 RepID=A0ABR2LVB6_9ASPA
MDPSSVRLEEGDIHGFVTLADLDIARLREDATTRWLRPNEIHAILTNCTHFTVQPQPVEYPTNGILVLFDRKMLRNFRKDGYNWKKKKDGKTVQEAHEKLKIGNEDKIHVYYARGEADPNFCRRCYWLLDKNLEHIVLVHYRQTLEDVVTPAYKDISNVAKMMHDSSPLTSVNSTSGSGQSDFSASGVMSEEINSREHHAILTGSGIFLSTTHTGLQINDLSQNEINNLDWADLALASEYIEPCMGRADDALVFCDAMQYKSGSSNDDKEKTEYLGTPGDQVVSSILPNACSLKSKPFIAGDEPKNMSLEWDKLKDDLFSTLDFPQISNSIRSNTSVVMDPSSLDKQIFIINDVSPEWGYSTEETKVVVIGNFIESHKHLEVSSIYCVLGDLCFVTQMVQPGIYRCTALPQIPGNVGLFLTFDGHTPISQVITFHYRQVPNMQLNDGVTSINDTDKSKPDIMTQKRLAHLLFSTSGDISTLSSKLLPKAIKEAKQFAQLTSPFIENDWEKLLKSGCKREFPSYYACEDLFELVIKNKLQQWLMEKIAEGSKATNRDSKGQGVIHLCTILDYTWAVNLFSLSGLSLDFRDTYGWTALHWAAYLGRERMVAALLSAGANPSFVTDPSPENPGGLTPADLASEGGHDGLAAYLAEKGLAAHFEAMSLSGNISSQPDLGTSKYQVRSEEDLYTEMMMTEEEVCLKESLAAYRNAADAADRIQAAFRERTLKLQTAAVQLAKPEVEASKIIGALKIQHAYRNHARRRLMKAAARIQSHFRTWRARKDFLNMRRQAIMIQAVFRGHLVRRQYRKILWSVGVLEKAILRWRLKKKGLRGMQVESIEVCKDNFLLQDSISASDSAEEDFFKMSRKQAEERVQRSVVRVQAMFRSYRAQQEYRRMKLTHEQAKIEFSSGDATGIH